MTIVETLVRTREWQEVEDRHEISTFGMWVFLASEVMFFGGVLGAFLIYRAIHFDAFTAASDHTNVPLGTLNTFVLIGSSLTMALAVAFSQHGRARPQQICLLLTAILGFVFLGVKGIEYAHKIEEGLMPGFHDRSHIPLGPEMKLFFSFYITLTGIHAVHLIIGIGAILTLFARSLRRPYDSEYYTPVDVTGLYWHFVDLVWIFLFPFLYLIG